MTSEKASVILEYLLPQIEQEAQTTSRLLAAVPAQNADYKPAETCMSARDLAHHIAAADVWFLESVANGEFKTPEDSSVKEKFGAELASTYLSQISAAVKRLQSLSSERLAAPLKFFVFEMPAIDLVQLMLKHSVHHRGQLSAYLRPMGARVPAIYGGSADEPVTAPQRAQA